MRRFFPYILSSKERKLWSSIRKKKRVGYKEFKEQDKIDPAAPWWCSCPPWIPDLTDSENELLTRIHKKFYGEDWCVVDPLGCSQVAYIKYEDVKFFVW